jgi:ferredoxin
LIYLKKIRVIVSLLFFVLTSIIFLDYIKIISIELYDYILFLQFVPSIVNFIDIIAIASIGFIIVLILVVLFGRVYCSSICPVGTLQDVISRVSKKFAGEQFYNWSKGLKWLRYSILILTVLSIPVLGILIVGLLDPLSNFGRILTNIVRPLILLMNNLLALFFESIGSYIIYPVDIMEISIAGIIFSFIILSTLLLMSIKRGRLFCNTICPVGSLLGIISKVAIFKIKINEDDCDACGMCATVCKAECINDDSKKIDFERCVVCFNCIRECPTSAINYYKGQYTEPDSDIKFSKSRRKFLSDFYSFVAGISGMSFVQVQIIPEKESTKPVNRLAPVSPPGSINVDHYKSTCTACHLCISVCPTQVLQPSILHYGLEGFLQPRMDYITNFCKYDCVLCTEVCPSGALQKFIPENKKLTQLGKSIFVKKNCIVETEKKACGACSEVCPTKAVRMVPFENKLLIPEVKNEYCVGCGACEYACPTIPYKAIYVEGNPEHLKAEIPPEEILEQKVDYKEEFPF